MSHKLDVTLAFLFAALTLGFILLMVFNTSFFEFSWKRHHNPLSWYIRPLMLLPLCYFAYKRSYAGMLFSIFTLATSMMWFSEPATDSDQAKSFLQMEIDYLSANWSFTKILMTMSIPIVFVLLGVTFWRRKVFWGFLVLILSIIMKMLWSVSQGGESGYVLFPAAILGILTFTVLLFLGQKKKWL